MEPRKTIHRIMKNGKIMVVHPSGSWSIQGHIRSKDGREIAILNGYEFELKNLNIERD